MAKYHRSIACLIVILATVAATTTVIMIKKKHHHRSIIAVPPSPETLTQKYSTALSVALQFFDVQKSGKLSNDKISWRGDSALNDGSEAGLDLSKGMYDAGDLVKFGFPMAFTATVLSWSILEYRDRMNSTLEDSLDSVKWITDYLINAHPSDNVLYIQVGDPAIDHDCWQRPEESTGNRTLTKITAETPGSEVAAETAAAMAAASMVFRTINATYSELLLRHARKLFTFADTYRGSYSESIPELQKYYNSTSYEDDLLWAASWLYHATGDRSYLSYVTIKNGVDFADWGRPTWFSWDDKRAGAQVLLSRVTFFLSKELTNAENKDLQMYRRTAESVICGLLPTSPTATASRTDAGLIWIDEWDALQHPVAASFLAVVYSDYMLTSRTPAVFCNGQSYTPEDVRNFAMSQADYILGDNPMKLSYLVGYGENFPQQVHHRGASIPVDAKTGCKGFQWLKTTDPNPNIAMGAMVGGPFKNDTYIDLRDNSMQAEPTTYNSALLVGLLSGLLSTSPVPRSLT